MCCSNDRRFAEAATTTLREALAAFEGMGALLLAERARAELAKFRPAEDGMLTPSEQRVAELVASGMTNRDVAVVISPKTVEANLARIYRKLGIRSRAELDRRMSQPTGREVPIPPATAIVSFWQWCPKRPACRAISPSGIDQNSTRSRSTSLSPRSTLPRPR